MTLDSTNQLGGMIGTLANNQIEIQQNISPQDPDNLFQIWSSEAIAPTSYVQITYKIYPNDAFIIDHPVYGNINSDVLLIDGGYESSTLQGTYLI